jgi:Skp family chaperone for outer membrane proteins
MVEANVANASAQQTLAHTTDKHHVSTALDAQKARHAEELHAVHMRKANADASLAEKKAKQSDFKKTQTKPSPKKSKGHG